MLMTLVHSTCRYDLTLSVVHQLKPGGFFGRKVEDFSSFVMDWYSTRSEVLAPRWVIGLFKLFSRGDAKVFKYLSN